MDLAHTIEELSVQAFGFLALFVILQRVAWRPLLALLDERRARIEEQFRQLAKTKDDLARLEAEYAQKLATIQHEARVKIQEAIIEGKRIGMEIQEQARAQGRELVTKSKETIELELAKAKVTLRDQLAGMTLEALEKILRQKVDAKADRQLVESSLEELERELQA